MDYKVFKGLLESLIQNYDCPNCKSKGVSEENIEIIGVAGKTANLNVTCPKCGKQTMIRTEVNQIDLNLKGEKVQLLKDKLKELLGDKVAGLDVITDGDTHKINEIEIMELGEKLKKDSSIEDLLDNN